MSDDGFVICECCSCCIDWPGSTLEDQMTCVLVEKGSEEIEQLRLPLAAECDDVLVTRADLPVVTETWCSFCIAGAARRGVYEFEGRRTFGRRHERLNRKGWGAQPVRVRLVSEDLK